VIGITFQSFATFCYFCGQLNHNPVTMPRNLAIFLFDDVEVLDFAGPFEVFSTAGVGVMDEVPFNVFTVAQKSQIIARNNLVVLPTYTFENCPDIDIVLIPGGGGYRADGTAYGSRREMDNELVINWIKEKSATAEMVLSVCTGALLLAKAALLDGLKATTHYRAIDHLRKIAPHTEVIENVRYVDNGRVILSAGVSAGIDMSFYVVSKLLGADVASLGAKYAQYDYWK
jgi:transcriptional regulator GlxA family with amidase domain